MEHHTAAGSSLYPEHHQQSENGFVTLVKCDPPRSGSLEVKHEQVYRTDRLAHLKREKLT